MDKFSNSIIIVLILFKLRSMLHYNTKFKEYRKLQNKYSKLASYVLNKYNWKLLT